LAGFADACDAGRFRQLHDCVPVDRAALRDVVRLNADRGPQLGMLCHVPGSINGAWRAALLLDQGFLAPCHTKPQFSDNFT
jgi:hypothetical protein